MSGGFPWLSVVTFLPLGGAVVLAAIPGSSRAAIRWWALVVSLATLGFAAGMTASFHGGVAGYQMVEQASWIGPANARYLVGVDGISVFMVLLTAFLMPVAVLSSWNLDRNPKGYFASFLLLETAVLGSFVALDLLLFFVFFEAMLIPMYLIIGGWGGRGRIGATIKFFLYTMAGSAFMLVAILFLYFKAGAVTGHPTFDVRTLMTLPLSVTAARWLFLAFLVAFAVKIPLVPLHTWLPDAYAEAPTAGTLMLSAVMAKVGAYGLIRFNLSLFPQASMYFRPLVMTLAVVAIVYGAVVAIVQTDVKRLVAYSSVSHLGFVALGTFALAGTLAAGTQALSGAVLYMVNHGLSTGALFLLAGMLAERVRTRNMDAMGGLAARVPLLAGVFLFVTLASVGLPGLNNFVSEFLVILGTLQSNWPFAAVAVSALVLSAVYMLWGYQRMMHGPERLAGLAPIAGGAGSGGEAGHGDGHGAPPAGSGGFLRDLGVREYLIVVPIMVAILFLGLYPKPLLSRIEPSARSSVACVQYRTQVAGLPRGALTLTRQAQALQQACASGGLLRTGYGPPGAGPAGGSG